MMISSQRVNMEEVLDKRENQDSIKDLKAPEVAAQSEVFSSRSKSRHDKREK